VGQSKTAGWVGLVVVGWGMVFLGFFNLLVVGGGDCPAKKEKRLKISYCLRGVCEMAGEGRKKSRQIQQTTCR